MNSYNGFTSEQREKKQRELNKLIKKGIVPKASGNCMMCNDPDAKVEYHDENYGEPYSWEVPHTYILCQHCHRHKLHKRFDKPLMWKSFKAHVRRGGYGSDLKDRNIKKEVLDYQKALEESKEPNDLRVLRPYSKTIGSEWFEKLRNKLK